MAGEPDALAPPIETIRPTSPEKFLAVPGGTSSRSNSLDQSPSSDGGETLVPPPSSEGKRHSDKEEEEEDEDPLRPDPGNLHEFQVEDNKFAFSPGQLGKLINPKNLPALKALGGIEGLEKGLRTDLKAGLSLDETILDGAVMFEEATGGVDKNAAPFEPAPPGRSATAGTGLVTTARHTDSFKDRLRVFKDNRLPERKSKSLLELMWIALMDKVLLLLSAAAVISLALGLYQTFGVQHDPNEGASVDWVEGVAIIVAIVIVVVVGAGNDWQKERQFVKLNKKKEDRTLKVIRSGRSLQISVYDLMVGDICHLEPGDLIPADGIFIAGHNVKCDESSATGESDQMKKIPAHDALAQWADGTASVHKLDPFIISGSKVLEGVGTYMVTSVGVHSSFGKTMMALREDSTATPLQMKLNDLAEAIAKLGGAAALLLFIVLLIRFLVNLRGNTLPASAKGQNFMRILITAITVVVVAVPEGLPLAVTLALAFATTRMLKDNNLVRVLQACETMGNATTVCSDKTGTLTQNKMTVVAGTLGTSQRFGDKRAPKSEEPQTGDADNEGLNSPMTQFAESLPKDIKNLLLQSIVQNSTAFEGEEDGRPSFIGSKTETAMLAFARDYLGMATLSEERANANVVQMVPFDSGRKCMGVVVKLGNEQYRLMVKGASEIVLARCTRIVTMEGPQAKLTPEIKSTIDDIISAYANRSLRTIGLLYRDFSSWPPQHARLLADHTNQAEFDDVFEDMTWLGIVGIQDPLRPGVHEAVMQCQKAGVFVRMVTGDNVMTAKAIAEECGIYVSGGLVMEGPKFRQLSQSQMDEVIPRLQVLARSSPEDKRILVRRLKELGETVAVTGDGTNDGPALKMADVGFSMGIAGTEVAKEASAIILMDDNFASIVKALMWGRAVNDAVKKFLQFQLTVNITAVLLTFVSAVASTNETSVLSAVQLLWVNLIMDTFAALALATDPPAPSILNRKPDPKSAPLITINMWKMIIGQAIFQLVVTFVLNFAGRGILGYPHDDNGDLQLKSLVFNTFVWMQIFNQYNNRRLDNKFNIFEGISHNWFFIGINFVMVGGQIMIIFVGGKAFSVTPLNGIQWAISIILGAISIPIAVIIRLIPDEFIAKIAPSFMTRKKTTPVYRSEEDRFEWNRGIEEIRQELSFLKMVRGGRLNQLKFRRQNIRDTMKENFSHMFRGGSKAELADGEGFPPPSSGSHKRRRSRSNSAFAAAAMVPSIVAGSIGGWSPVERAKDAKDGELPPGNKAESEGQQVAPAQPRTSSEPVIHEAEESAPSKPPA
ncbi:calcium-translocating P-type ATPase [Wilcoxina mikolae CBS 423.85]|nr:calcium-translocating P-type ATPase [Wilcoxina mikolae CBS 423.85]